ncbi:MAG: hypothetical protein LQ343_002227 [Gyalolechia ehrenbergii]|nr:MAG: hypothetical protein LQ343_002227 [Gyalolechia ehrenbergii]
MDFTLSLAHFCENDGPTSILCTQALPISCRTCWGPKSIESSLGDLRVSEQEKENLNSSKDGENNISSQAATTLPSNSISSARPGRPYKTLGDNGGCASCTFSVPKEYIMKIPSGAPGSPKDNGVGTNGSPILRSKAKIPVWGSPHSDSDADDDGSFHQSSPTSVTSSATTVSSFHEHHFECRTTSSPVDPNTYAILRRACIQTLSCEQLPRGLTSGRLSFQDSFNGLTIAWKFRLPDPHARGRQRHYALLAVVHPESSRAMEASPLIWSAFERIVYNIMADTENLLKQGQCPPEGKPLDLLNVSSFLTGRTVDPDGFPRRGGINMRARSLVEIVGDEYFFPRLHLEFTRLLRTLADRFGEILVEPRD